jgi:uncharacterized protein (DUF305 family)
LISIGDLVKAVIEQQQIEINQLQNYIAGWVRIVLKYQITNRHKMASATS